MARAVVVELLNPLVLSFSLTYMHVNHAYMLLLSLLLLAG
jgi:hypothetical protein